MELEALQKALLACWSRDTCYPPIQKDWSPENPAFGQCYVTALVVNDYFGGDILETTLEDGVGHFWNRVDDAEIDLTRCQFDKDEVIPPPTVVSRKELDANPSHEEYRQRYRILKARVVEVLGRD